MLGGDATHTGSVPEKVLPTLIRRWSFPSVPPSRREAALIWSAPVAAYGLVAASAATNDGEAHLFAFDAVNGAPLWDAYALPDPVYPDRGGCALAAGRLYAATVEGGCVCLDVQRGTRLWETRIRGRVYGSVTVAREHDAVLVAAIHEGAGILYFLDAVSGKTLREVSLPGPSDTAPAFADGLVFIHDDSGTLSAIDVTSGTVQWSVNCGAGFDSAPVIRDGFVFSLTGAGTAWCHEAATGTQIWQMAVTNAPFSGTPAHDGTLLYMPANDGLHLFSAVAGKPVRRYPLKMPIRSAPVVMGGTLFFGATDGNIYAAASGRPLDRAYETSGIGAQFVAAPAFSDGTFFVVSTNGVLYALSLVPPLPPTSGGVPVGS
jgi:outer membrane protein assembly factor BamB